MPGVTTARRPATARPERTESAASAPAGFELKVSSITVTPLGARATPRRFSTVVSDETRPATSAGSRPRAMAAPIAQATFVGCRPVSTGLAPTLVPSISMAHAVSSMLTTTSASRRTEATRMTRLPARARRSASPERSSSSMLMTTTSALGVISALAARVTSRLPNRSRCTGPMAVITAIDGGHQAHMSAISPGP